MSTSLKYMLIAATIVFAATAGAADVPNAGQLLRESAPPPSLKQQQEPPKIEPLQQQKEAAPHEGVRVRVSGFTFTGNTVISSAELTALLSGYIGKELTFAELNDAAATITNAYRARGYFLASVIIPPQTIKANAPILIQIVEGVLEGIRLETRPAEPRTPLTLLQRYINRVPTGKAADEGTLSDMVMRINELPGITSRILLEPGSQAGTTKALLEVTEGKPYSVSVDTDNHGNYSTGYYRIGSSLELYSPLHLGDLYTLRAQTSYSGDSQSVQTGYNAPVSGSGTKIGFNYSFVTYQLGKSFKALNASGDAHDLSLTVTQPLIRSRSLILNASLGSEAKFLSDKTDSAGLNNKRHSISGQFSVNGVQMDTLLGAGSTSFFLNYTRGFVGIDDATTKMSDQSATGLHTDGGYNKLAMSLSRNQSLYKTLSFYAGVNGQWASSNLDSAEQFSLGGPGGVRAFPVSEASCDSGIVSTGELRYLIGTLGSVPGSLQLAAFFDHGYAVLHADPIAPNNEHTLSGTGIGLAWFDADSFSFRTSVAWRLGGIANGQSEITEPTVYFQLIKRF
jgi:hemolysin activation/secretion protein